MTEKKKLTLKIVAGAAAIAVLALARGMVPEIVRYLRIKRM